MNSLSIKVLLQIWRRRLLSYAVFLFIVTFIAVLIAWRYPIARELAISSVSYAQFNFTSEMPSHSDQAQKLIKDVAPGRVLSGANFDADLLNAKNNKITSGSIVITSTPESADLSMLPDALRLKGSRENSSGSWIDINHNMARDLDVTVGDLIQINLGITDSDPIVIVRGIYAATGTSGENIALASIPELSEKFSSKQNEFDFFYVWVAGVDEKFMISLRNEEPYKSLLNNAGIDSTNWSLSSHEEIKNYTLEYTKTQVRFIKLLGALSAILIFAVFFREVRYAKESLKSWLPLLNRIGISNTVIRKNVYTFYSFFGSVILLFSSFAMRIVYSGFFGNLIFPPTLNSLWLYTTISLCLLPFIFFMPMLKDSNESSVKS